MKTQIRMTSASVSMSLIMTLLGTVACADASAFGRSATKPPVVELPPPPPVDTGTPAPVTAPAPVVAPAPIPTDHGNVTPGTTPISAGTFEQGLEIGRRNGDLIAQRLTDRTVGTEGCTGIGKLERGLLAVTRSIRPPASASDALVRGFYRGYLNSVREAIRSTRRGCDLSRLDRGDVVGEIYGSLLCQVASLSVEAVTRFEVESLYAGWATTADVVAECRTSVAVTVRNCGGNDALIDSLSVTIHQSCADSTLED